MFLYLFIGFKHLTDITVVTGVTGGLAAPLVAAGAGAVLGAGGAAALGSATGIAIMASLFGAAGAGLTGKSLPPFKIHRVFHLFTFFIVLLIVT